MFRLFTVRFSMATTFVMNLVQNVQKLFKFFEIIRNQYQLVGEENLTQLLTIDFDTKVLDVSTFEHTLQQVGKYFMGNDITLSHTPFYLEVRSIVMTSTDSIAVPIYMSNNVGVVVYSAINEDPRSACTVQNVYKNEN